MKYDFESSVGYWVTIVSLAYRKALNEELAPHGITFRQSQVLGWLVHDGVLSQSSLAAKMEVEAPTLKGLVDRMEAAGWVKRCSCMDDRRKKLIRMTSAAEPVWQKIADCARKVRREATAGLNRDETNQLLHLLRTVHNNLILRSEVPADEIQIG
ncbi:MAG: MarR family transcriptional regulator [Planctomycetaceae bacterium]|nr:MarR family transcriptional regulator [Planctomycetaceae bacterium]